MDREEIKSAASAADLFYNYPKKITEIVIQPMGETWGRENYNIRVIVNHKFMSSVRFVITKEKDVIPGKWQKKINIRESEIFSHIHSLSGANFIPCMNKFEYTMKSNFLYEIFMMYFKMFDKSNTLINKVKLKDNNFKLQKDRFWYDESAINRYLREEVDKRLKEKEVNYPILKRRLSYLEKKIKTVHDMQIAGKIITGTSLTRMEVLNNKNLIKASKELIKLKSYLRSGNKLIKV